MKRKSDSPSPACLAWEKTFSEAWDIRERIMAIPNVREKPMFNTEDDAKAWAVDCTIHEALACNVDIRQGLRDARLAKMLHQRFGRWVLARLRWRLYQYKKLCPDVEYPDEKIAYAAFLGWIASNKFTASDPRVVEFLQQAPTLRDADYNRFKEWQSNPKSAPWRHPDLDTWLMLMWPLVEAQRWTYAAVLRLAEKRFPDKRGHHPVSHHRDFAKYCKALGLRVRARAGNPGAITTPAAIEQFALKLEAPAFL
jgi:hypothetical protein